MANVTSILGGKKELGISVSRRIDFDSIIKRGIPWRVITHVKKAFNLSDEIIARVIGISPRTVARRRKIHKTRAQRLSPIESDRLYRFARIIALAEDVFENKEDALEWLKIPKYGLGGRVPFEILQTYAGVREVEDLLIRI